MVERTANTFVMTRLPWIVAAIAVMALVVTLLYTRKPGGGANGSHEGDATQEILSRLEALERSRLGSGALQPGARAGMTGPGDASGMDEMIARSQKTPEQMAAELKRDLQMLEGAFARDRADPVRGGQVERTLEQTVTSEAMAGTGLEPDDVAIDCRATTCKIVGQFAKRGDAEDWALFYVTSAGGNVLTQTRMAYVPRPDGSTEVRIYATRAR